MMELEQAKQFAEQHFPEGPEKLAARLGIQIRESELTGCDGWVLTGPAGVLIRLNRKAAANRRRFTLAHELGHLLLDVPTIVGESVYDSLRSNNTEERKVNDLAAELLLPKKIVRQELSSVPVVAKQLKRLAKKANISELAAAIRVANLADHIGLVNASVAFFKDDRLEWQWSKKLAMTPQTALALLRKTRDSHPKPARIAWRQKNAVIVASMLPNPMFRTATVFVQLLSAEEGTRLSDVERRQELESYLFKNANEFRMSLQGVFGAFRPKCATLTLETAIREFYEKFGSRWSRPIGARLRSPKGREYVRLRLSQWCPHT